MKKTVLFVLFVFIDSAVKLTVEDVLRVERFLLRFQNAAVKRRAVPNLVISVQLRSAEQNRYVQNSIKLQGMAITKRVLGLNSGTKAVDGKLTVSGGRECFASALHSARRTSPEH